MPVNPWDFRFEGDPDDDPDDLGADLEAAFKELEKLRYLFPSTDEFIYVADEDPVLNEYVVRKGTRRPDKYSCLRYWQFLVLDGPTAKTAYHMRACEFCRTTMREAVDSSASANLKALYDRLWTMPLDPTDEEVDQMEALADLKNALRELEDEAAADRVAARKAAADSQCTLVDDEAAKVDAQPAHPMARAHAKVGRRRFLAAVAALGLLATGFAGHVVVSSLAAPVRKPKVGNASASSDFAKFDKLMNAGGITAIQASYASGTESDAIRIVAWIGLRKDPNAMAFLVACMTDPRIAVRWGSVREGLRLPPIMLKPHLPALIAAAMMETNPAIQNLFSVLVTAVQNA